MDVKPSPDSGSACPLFHTDDRTYPQCGIRRRKPTLIAVAFGAAVVCFLLNPNEKLHTVYMPDVLVVISVEICRM